MRSLDERVNEMADRMAVAGSAEAAAALRVSMDYVHNAYIGKEVRQDVTEDLQIVVDFGQVALNTILRYQDRL